MARLVPFARKQARPLESHKAMRAHIAARGEIWNSFTDYLESTQLEVTGLFEEDYARAVELLLEFGVSFRFEPLLVAAQKLRHFWIPVLTKSYRSRHPLRVTGERTDWQGHTPDVVKAMKDRIERPALEPIDD